MRRLALSLLLLAAPLAGQSARDFDGSDDSLTCGDIDALDGLDSLTVFAWAWLDDDDTVFGDIVEKASAWELRKRNTEAPIFTVGAGSAIGTTIMSTGVWNCLVGTYDRSLPSARQKIYLNGVLDGSANATDAATPSNANAVTIGGTALWDGKIAHAGAEARVWSVTEIVEYCRGNLAQAQRAAGGTGGYLSLMDPEATPTTYRGQGVFAGVCSATNHPAVSSDGPRVFIPGGGQ